MDKFGQKDEDSNGALPSDTFLGLRIKNNVYVAESEDETDDDTHDDTDQQVAFQRPKSKARTKAFRNRFERHLGRLKEV